jgi:YafQ family addiction module toxin component
MYSLEIKPELDSKFEKLAKKNKKQFEIIINKFNEILENPHRYKNLRAPMNHLKRVHIDKHFVLIFSINEESKRVTLVDYDHHDNIYR